MVLWMMSPSTRAVAVSRTFKPRTRPTTRPFTTTSSAMTSPLIVALSPTVSRCARMSPSTVPSTLMSPVVLRLPVMCRSLDRIDAAGFALGAEALNSEDDGRDESGMAGLGELTSSALGPGSLILLLENIVCSLDVDHGVDGFAADTDFVV